MKINWVGIRPNKTIKAGDVHRGTIYVHNGLPVMFLYEKAYAGVKFQWDGKKVYFVDISTGEAFLLDSDDVLQIPIKTQLTIEMYLEEEFD